MRRGDLARGIALLAALAALALLAVWIAGGTDGEREAAMVEPRAEPRMARAGLPGVFRVEQLDADERRAAHPKRKGAPVRFAEAAEVEVTPESHGRWRTVGGVATWTLDVEAPGALNLNFGFTRFALPESASFEIQSAGGELLVRPFTAADNDAHGELWTPVVAGDEARLVLTVAEHERERVQLRLGAINRGFRELAFAAGALKIGSNAPEGNCHVDVVCSAAQSGVGPAIDAYRDQIRAGGLYTLSGIDTCSGAAVNNTRNDGTPYFLTADHCGVRSSNAASMVVYWNFENSACRTPGSSAAGSDGDGPVTDFNSGAIMRATWATADATLVELDDPIDPAHAVFLAGWSRTGTPGMTAGVHHPALSEKRISFDFDPARSTDEFGDNFDANGTHWRVIDWDHGSTEGGSSGSPLFDENGRIVGQLTGGDAACGNNDSDWYGKFAAAWTGGGSPSSRLREWLDPENTGALTLDGLDLDRPKIRIADTQIEEGDSGTTQMEFLVTLSEAAGEAVDLVWSTQDGVAQAGADFAGVSNVPLSFAAGETAKTIAVEVHGDTDPEEHETFTVTLALTGSADVFVADGVATGTIRNDDFVPPVIVGPSVVNGSVAEELSAAVVSQNTPTQFSLSGAPAGMTISGDGVISWVPAAGGSFDVMVTAANPAGMDTATITFVIGANPLADAVEVPGEVALSTGGASSWIRHPSSDAIQGGDRARSGSLGDDQSSWLEAQVEGPDYLGFWWKVSSEADYDFLNLDVDGVRRMSISGLSEWAYEVIVIPSGRHTVRWSYEKDLSVSEGADQGWVDFIQLASASRPFLMEPPVVHVIADVAVDYRVPTFVPGASFSPLALPGGLSLNEAGELAGTPPSAGVHPFTLAVQQDGVAMQLPARVEVHAATSLGTALGQPGIVWSTGSAGSPRWYPQSGTSRDGLAAKEQNTADGQTAEMKAFVNGPGRLSFWWKVSSEEHFDGIVLELNGVFQDSITGEVDWTQKTIDLPYGRHAISWLYVKDESLFEGQDTGWVDQVEFEGYAGWALAAGLGDRTNVVFDPDRDGQNLFFEYATGGSATQRDAMSAPVLVGGALEWEVAKPAGVIGVAYDAETSGDLLDWTRSARVIVQDDAAIFRARDTGGGPGPRFMRGTVHPEE